MSTIQEKAQEPLMETLLRLGLVTAEKLEGARMAASQAGVTVVDQLLAEQAFSQQELAHAKAECYNLNYVNLATVLIPDEILAAIPRHLARKFQVVPVFLHADTIGIAIGDPAELDKIDTLQNLLRLNIEPQLADQEALTAAVKRYYGADESLEKAIQDITMPQVDPVDLPSESLEVNTPILQLVNRIFVDAYNQRASDIHFEPLPEEFRIRFRVDGVMHRVKSPGTAIQPSIISMLKIQAGMKLDVKRLPQDGRIRATIAGRQIDMRVSCLPTNYGESIVIRILDKEGMGIHLGDLGLLSDDQQKMEELIALPDGIILITGPTGSGKTTTLYSVLKTINQPDRKILTVEDPVEYLLSGINQVQVHEAIGMTFASVLRSMLRQAPNVIMLGEIRDLESATIAMNAALTGHLVFSTLHTNDAPSAVTRLIDIGVKPFLIATGARAMIAQRLVRKICPRCAEPTVPEAWELEKLGVKPEECKVARFMRGRGCPACHRTGYRGRIGLFEIFILDEEIQNMVYRKAAADSLRAQARSNGMHTLREDGIRKVFAGMTTPLEVVSATVDSLEKSHE